MADPARNVGTGGDTGVEPGRGSTTGLARWQKVVGIIGLVVVLALGVLMFGTGSGGHGPARHAPDERQGQQIDVEDDGGHDPSQGGH